MINKIKEFFSKKPKANEASALEKEIEAKAEEVNNSAGVSPEVKAESRSIFGKIKDMFKNRKKSNLEGEKYKEVNKTDMKYEEALNNKKNGEQIEMEINGKTVRFQKNGETYDLMHNGA